jgi:hypothetical protein
MLASSLTTPEPGGGGRRPFRGLSDAYHPLTPGANQSLDVVEEVTTAHHAGKLIVPSIARTRHTAVRQLALLRGCASTLISHSLYALFALMIAAPAVPALLVTAMSN